MALLANAGEDGSATRSIAGLGAPGMVDGLILRDLLLLIFCALPHHTPRLLELAIQFFIFEVPQLTHEFGGQVLLGYRSRADRSQERFGVCRARSERVQRIAFLAALE